MAEPSADLIAWLAAANEALVVYAKVFASEGYENFGMLRDIKEDERDDILEALDAAGIKKVRWIAAVWRAPKCMRVFCRPAPLSLFYGCARSFRRRPAAGAQRAMRRITCTNTYMCSFYPDPPWPHAYSTFPPSLIAERWSLRSTSSSAAGALETPEGAGGSTRRPRLEPGTPTPTRVAPIRLFFRLRRRRAAEAAEAAEVGEEASGPASTSGVEVFICGWVVR